MSSSIKMKKLLKQDILGNIYNVFVTAGQYLPDWRPSIRYEKTVSAKQDLGGGVLLELSHEIDYIQWLLGPLKIHYAQLRNSSELNLEVEEIADLVLTTNRGVVCNIHLDFLQKNAIRTCSFVGNKGRIDWNLLANKIQLHTKEKEQCLFFETNSDSNKMYLELIKNFLNLISGRPNSCVDLEQATGTIELIDNIKKISLQGVKQ